MSAMIFASVEYRASIHDVTITTCETTSAPALTTQHD